jgi:hypothetical protein
MGTITALPTTVPNVFWAEMSPCEHVVQIYGDDRVFLDGLEGFVANGLRNGEAAIVIATATHLHGLEKRMRQNGVDVERAREESRYVPRLAEDVLVEFMVKDWPDEALFLQSMEKLIRTARGEGNRRVRAFGEMVAILWARGNHAATIHLELLWTKVLSSEKFPLFCAYPRDTFSKNATESIVEICRIHSRVAPPSFRSGTDGDD